MKVILKQDVLIFDGRMGHIRLLKGTKGMVIQRQGEILGVLIDGKKYKLNQLLVEEVRKDETNRSHTGDFRR